MSSNLRVNNILPSVGNNVAIGTAGGSVTLTGSVTGDITSSGVSTFTTLSATNIVGVSTLGVTTAYINTLSGISTIDASSAVSINQNLVFASGKGIDFSATSDVAGMTSELLDDYEEGTWTGELTGSTTNPTTPINATGYYTKIGNLVTVSIEFNNVNTTGASGGVRVTGLPFTIGQSAIGSCISYNFDFPTGLTSVSTLFIGGSANVDPYVSGDVAVWSSLQHSAGVGRYLRLSGSYRV